MNLCSLIFSKWISFLLFSRDQCRYRNRYLGQTGQSIRKFMCYISNFLHLFFYLMMKTAVYQGSGECQKYDQHLDLSWLSSSCWFELSKTICSQLKQSSFLDFVCVSVCVCPCHGSTSIAEWLLLTTFSRMLGLRMP